MRVIPWEHLDWPLDLGAAFEETAPVVLEIGYGNGDFLIRLAQENPEVNYLGIEIAWSSTQRLLAKSKRHALTNLCMMQGNAAFIVDRVLPRDALSGVYINFSDPWPKPRHHHKRVVQQSLLPILEASMNPGAELTIATDHAEYADWIADTLDNQNYFENTQATTRIHSIVGRIPTRYESKAIQAGIPINYYLWKKPDRATPSPPTPSSKVSDMPNMTFKGCVDQEQLVLNDHFTLVEDNRGEKVHVKFIGIYHNPSAGTWIVESLVQEDEFTQHFALLFAPRKNQLWVLKLASMAAPRPTWGVKRALGRFGEWLLVNQPGLTLVGDTTGVETSMPGTVTP